MKKNFIIFDFSNGHFFDVKTWKWKNDLNHVTGWVDKQFAEDILEKLEPTIPWVQGHNYVVMTIFKKLYF